jgi:hydroxyquinol 1,2-dioxygenase
VDGQPIEGTIVDVWHSDKEGYYDVQHLEDVGGLSGRARFRTGPEGEWRFWSIKPAAYPIPYDGPIGQMLTARLDVLVKAPDSSEAKLG